MPVVREPKPPVAGFHYQNLIFYNFGAGQDSAAIVALKKLGRLPARYNEFAPEQEFLVMSNTGRELPETYLWMEKDFNPWLEQWSPLRLDMLEPWGPYHAKEPYAEYPEGRLMGDIMHEFMKDEHPSFPVFKSARCTDNAKQAPLGKYRNEKSLLMCGRNNDQMAISGHRHLVVIGIAADELDRALKSPAVYYDVAYPLVELGMTRADCRDVIEEAGLALPMKSGCDLCPWAPPQHFYWLMMKHPQRFAEVEAMEQACINDRLSRGLKPNYIQHKVGLPIREAALAWHQKKPDLTVEEIEHQMYYKDLFAVGRKPCMAEPELEPAFAGGLDLDLSNYPVFEGVTSVVSTR